MASPPPPSPPASPPRPPPPPPPPDLHTLVALAASFQTKQPHLPVENWRLNHPDKPRALDAIAALCVDPENPRPVAVALTIDSKIPQVRLLISHDGADRLDARLLDHLRKTWRHLRTLSREHLNPTPGTGQIIGVGAMFRYVYLVHQVELRRVFREWWPKLDAAHRTAGRHLRHRKPDLFSERFMSVALALRMADRIMGDDLSLLTREQWGQLLGFMEKASTRVRMLFQFWKDCGDLGMDFRDFSYCRSTARCALENLTSLHRHLNLLTGFARFPRPINFFSHSLHVSFLPLSSRPTQLPIDWKPTLLNFSHPSRPLNNWSTRKADGLTTTYSAPQHCTPHPECALVMYLQSKRGGPTPALGYIGLSAPACAACDLWMDAYRARKIMRFHYRGGSNVWCWPWAFTRGVDEEGLVKDISGCCRHYLTQGGAFNYDYDSVYSNVLLGARCKAPPWALIEDSRLFEDSCLFGCPWRKERGCRCIALLWGEPQEKQEDDSDDDDFWF